MHPSQEKDHDPVNHPSHYTQGGVECIDAIESMIKGMDPKTAFLAGQVIKYVWRHPSKNGYEDLLKAEWYLKRLMTYVAKYENELLQASQAVPSHGFINATETGRFNSHISKDDKRLRDR